MLTTYRCKTPRLIIFLLASSTGFAGSAFAGPYDAPVNYYSTATSTGATLKQQLNDIIDGHTVRSYNDARFSLQVTDRDPNNASRILLIYNRASNTAAWDKGATWNREHTWPDSIGISGIAQGDLFNLRPANPQINSNRGNTPFGGAYGAQPFGNVTDAGSTFWYPGNADAGMVARQMFYMDTRYDGTDGVANLTLVNGRGGTNARLGNLSRLLEWHYAAVPDTFEQRRNHIIYTNYQNNRNPFIDRPELAWSVFADQQNDTRLSVAPAVGSNPINPDGSSTLNLELATVYTNAASTHNTTFKVNKDGVDGTYYRLAASNGASFTGDERSAFTIGAAGSRTVNASLTASTATAGLRTGTITVDNLDVTTQGGAGRGANDANDTVNLSLRVLDHGRGSFSNASHATTQTLDLGIVALGSAAVGFNTTVYNLNATAGFTGDIIVGSPTVLAGGTSITSFTGSFGTLTAGASALFAGSLNPTLAGAVNTTYRFDITEPALAGSTNPTDLTFQLKAHVARIGDANLDGLVNDDDYNALRLAYTGHLAAGQGNATWQMGDFDRDGDVDFSDVSLLRIHWTPSAEPLPDFANIPEPAAVTVIMLLALATSTRRRSA